LENPITSRYFATLVNGQGPSAGFSTGEPLIALAADDIFYQREDRLCSGLRDGVVVDFRGWDDEARYNEALSALVQAFTAPRDSAPF